MSAAPTPVALVSGGNRGIGLAVVGGLAEHGLTVVLGSRDHEAGDAARRTLGAGGATVHPHQLDVTDVASIDACIATIERELGRLDVLVNNAGVELDEDGRAAAPDLELVRRTLEVNLFGPWQLSVAALPLMRAGGGGRIINVSSRMGQLEDMGGGAPGYRVSKAGLNALTRMLSAELGPSFAVNSVCPGWVRTAMGGRGAPRSPAQGADTIVWLATMDAAELPRGGFFHDRERVAW